MYENPMEEPAETLPDVTCIERAVAARLADLMEEIYTLKANEFAANWEAKEAFEVEWGDTIRHFKEFGEGSESWSSQQEKTIVDDFKTELDGFGKGEAA